MTLDDLTRRDFLIISGLTGLGYLTGCRDNVGDESDGFRAPTPTSQPGTLSQSDLHNYSGNAVDENGSPVPGRVFLSHFDIHGNLTGAVFSGEIEANGRFAIYNVPTGDYVVDITRTDPSANVGLHKTMKIIKAQGDDIREDYLLFRKKTIDQNSFYANFLDMMRDLTGNKTNEPVQKVRRFSLPIKVFLNRNNIPVGYEQSILESLNQWESKTGLTLFNEVSLARDSNIEIKYERTGLKGLSQILNYGSVNGVSIPLKTLIKIRDNLSSGDAKTASARELGYLLFGGERYSSDLRHVTYKSTNPGDLFGAIDVSTDEGNLLSTYFNLPAGLSIKDYIN